MIQMMYVGLGIKKTAWDWYTQLWVSSMQYENAADVQERPQWGGDGEVASAGLRAQRRNIDPRSSRLASHRPDGWPSLDGGSV